MVTFWGWKVNTFCFSYDAEEDIIVIIPIDEDSNQFEEAALAVDPDFYGHFLEKLQSEYKGIMDVRRSVLRAKKKGIPAEKVQDRYRAQVIAEDIDEALRIQSKKDKHKEWDVPKKED